MTEWIILDFCEIDSSFIKERHINQLNWLLNPDCMQHDGHELGNRLRLSVLIKLVEVFHIVINMNYDYRKF